MFGLFKKPSVVHEPVETQRKEAVSSVAVPFREILGAKYLNGLDCDRLPNGKGVFGSLENPIPVNGLIGEIKYLVKLRGRTGEPLMFHRVGSMGSPVVDDPVDCYEVVCMDATQWNHLYFDFTIQGVLDLSAGLHIDAFRQEPRYGYTLRLWL